MSIEIEEICSKEQFENIIKNQHVVIDMFAEWCGPCQKIMGPMNQLASQYSNITFVKVDIDKLNFLEIELSEPDTIPCILYFQKGKQVKMLNTSNMDEIKNGLSVFH